MSYSETKQELDFDKVSNVNIESFEKLISPDELKKKLPITNKIKKVVLDTRKSIENILNGTDKRLLCIVGPCSIHDIEQAKTYGEYLKLLSNKVKKLLSLLSQKYKLRSKFTVET